MSLMTQKQSFKNKKTDETIVDNIDELQELISSFSLQCIPKDELSNLEIKEEDILEVIKSTELKINYEVNEEEQSNMNVFQQVYQEEDMLSLMKNEKKDEEKTHDAGIMNKQAFDINSHIPKECHFSQSQEIEYIESDNGYNELKELFKDVNTKDKDEVSYLKDVTQGLSADLVNMNMRFEQKENYLKSEVEKLKKELQTMTSLYEFERTKVENYKGIIKKNETSLKQKSGELVELCEHLEMLLDKI